jgi:hypothetical protein
MSDMAPLSSINTGQRSSLANVEAKLCKLIPALDAFASELAATPRSARRLAECCGETLAVCPEELAAMADVLRVLGNMAATFGKDMASASREIVPTIDQLNRLRRQIEIARRKER